MKVPSWVMTFAVTSVTIIGPSDQAPGGQLVYDCRFWREPRSEVARAISEDRAMKLDTRDPGVFYWWDSHRAECLPCSVCPERTLTMCSYIRDTECVTQREWVRRGLGIPGAVMSPGGATDTDTEGVVVFRSLSDSDSDKQPAVFGVPVYTTDDSIQVKDTPTRKIQRKYRNRAGEKEEVVEPGMEEEEQYGTPTFYSHEGTLAESSVHQSSATKENRPILTILREILNSNKSLEMSAKDVTNGTKGGPSHYDIARHFNKQRTFEEVTTMGDIRNVNIYKHSSPPPAVMPHGGVTLKPFTPRHKPFTTSLAPGAEASDYSEAGPDYEDKFKQIWPYRTDDKYSLFYFHPDRGQERGEGAEYPWPSLSDDTEVYSHHEYEDYEARHADTEGDNLNREPGQSTDRSLETLLSGDEYFDSDEENTRMLENILISVISLVVVLVVILVYITFKTRSKQNRFKLLDNSDNISSYQSVSPADTILPPASPSPLASRRPSGVSGLLSPTPSVHRSRSGSPMMPPGAGGHTMYDRSKLSIPLQRYNISSPSSSSSSPLARSPVSSLDQSLINNPSVARSLRNIKQNSDNKQHIELGLNDKLF